MKAMVLTEEQIKEIVANTPKLERIKKPDGLQRRRDLDEGVVAPLSGPSYGPFNIAKRRWRKPLPAIIADAIVNCQGLSARLQRGMWMPPDLEKKARYEKIFHQLCRSTCEQLAALQAFAEIDWRE
jgi:hypothetical protein